MNKKLIIGLSIALLVALAAFAIYSQSKRATISLVESEIAVEQRIAELEKSAVNTDPNDTESSDLNDSPAPIELVTSTAVFGDGTEATFALASAFDLAIAAEGLGKARFIAMSPDNRIFVPNMINLNLSREGRIIILDDFDNETRRFKSQSIYLSGLRGPNSVAFYTDREGNEWIYIALTERLIRYPYSPGDKTPSSKPELVSLFPNKQSPVALGVVWHITRTITFHDDTLYVSVGSGCNACEEPEGEMRAMIIAMDPDGNNARVYAEGLRNAVGIAWAEDALYATGNGVDHLGDGAPDDVMYKITDGEHYGWPYCYESNSVVLEEKSRLWERKPIFCEDVSLSFTAFEPHSAPLGLAYFENAHSLINNTFLVALHGSHEVRVGNGYRIVRVSQDGTQDTFMEGFLGEDKNRIGRPVHILQNDKNSFFFTDDLGGRLYYVYAK